MGTPSKGRNPTGSGQAPNSHTVEKTPTMGHRSWVLLSLILPMASQNWYLLFCLLEADHALKLVTGRWDRFNPTVKTFLKLTVHKGVLMTKETGRHQVAFWKGDERNIGAQNLKGVTPKSLLHSWIQWPWSWVPLRITVQGTSCPCSVPTATSWVSSLISPCL